MVDLSLPSDLSRTSGGIRMAMSSQQFCLRWNNHQSNMLTVFESLLQSELFTDVSIAVEGRTLKAHKMVLSACSPYFQAVLSSHPDKHPIVILKDIRYTDMRDLLDFMYRGEVSVDQENLSTFLRVAQSLRIKGLTEVGDKRGEPYLIQGAAPGSPSSTNVTTNGSIAFAPPSTLPGAPTTPLPGDPPPLKRPALSPSSQTAKRRRGRPPKISGDESESDVAISHDEESRSGSSIVGGGIGSVGIDTEIKAESDDGTEQKEHENRPPSHQAADTKPGPSGELIAKDLTKSAEDNDTLRQSPGSGRTNESWHAPVPNQDVDQEDSSSNLSSSLASHQSPLSLVSPLSKHASPATDIVDQRLYTNILDAMRKRPYDPLQGDNNLHGSILLASLKYGAFPGVYPAGDREAIEREYLETANNSPHTSPQKPSQSSPTLPSPGSLGAIVAGVMPTIPQGSSGSFNGNRSPHRSNNSSNGGESNGGTGGRGGKGVSVPIMSYCIQDNGFKCSKCFQTFTHPSNFHRHYITVHTDRRNHKCSVCGKEFKRKDNMMSHMRSVHRPGRESHNIYRDVNAVTQSLVPYDMNNLKCEKVPPPMIGQ